MKSLTYILPLLFLLGLSSAWANTQPTTGATIVALADATVTSSAKLIVGFDSSRVSLSCTNNHASVNVRWGPSSVTSSTGQRIPFGTAVEIRSIGEVYMISEGANVTVSCTVEKQ